jgi:hypothetical protein
VIRPKPGDAVLHRPSNETWVVAIADPSRDHVVACGWPLSIDKLSDCDIVEEVSVEVARNMAKQIYEITPDERGVTDYRANRVKELYPELFTQEGESK